LSQSVGITYRTKIPSLSDDASIEEALRVYHYGVDNYSAQPIPADSIEGNFKSINDRVDGVQEVLDNLGVVFIEAVSSSSSPNIITPQSSSTVPLTIRGASGQTANLQRWQNSAQTSLAVIFSDGSISTSGYISSGTNSQSTTIAADIRIKNSSHKGITIRRAPSQSENLQEWQNSSGNAISWVNKDGEVNSLGSPVQIINSFLLMGS
jgi:hypothetical protein